MISVCYLVNFAHGNILVAGHLARFLLGPLAFDQRLFLARRVILRRFHQDVGARAVTVVGVRGHNGTICRSALAHGDGGALHTLCDGVDFILSEAGKCYK